jgi:plasmid stability protein
MALDLKAVQVRLPEDAYEALRLVAAVDDKDLGEAAREILTRALLGEAHVVKVAAARYARATTSVKPRKHAVEEGSVGEPPVRLAKGG